MGNLWSTLTDKSTNLDQPENIDVVGGRLVHVPFDRQEGIGVFTKENVRDKTLKRKHECIFNVARKNQNVCLFYHRTTRNE